MSSGQERKALPIDRFEYLITVRMSVPVVVCRTDRLGRDRSLDCWFTPTVDETLL